VEKAMVAGVNFCGASLGGARMKRRLVHQPELRLLLGRYSGHHPNDPELGKRVSPTEYGELLVSVLRYILSLL
jgi:hypothetical protein